MAWPGPLPNTGWFNLSLLLGQQICKPQVSSISLKIKRRKKRKENHFPKPCLSSRPIMAQGLATAQGPWDSGSGDSAPGWGSAILRGEQTPPEVICCFSTRTQQRHQKQPRAGVAKLVGQEVNLHPPPTPDLEGHPGQQSMCSRSCKGHQFKGWSQGSRDLSKLAKLPPSTPFPFTGVPEPIRRQGCWTGRPDTV